jgi:hypothetical protein
VLEAYAAERTYDPDHQVAIRTEREVAIRTER